MKCVRGLLTLGLVSAGAPFALSVIVASKASVPVNCGSSTAARHSSASVAVHASGRGRPFLNLQDGRETDVEYRGECDLTGALLNGGARPRALASADFDHNGTPDVVAGYAADGAGLLTLQRGNPDAFAPASDAVLVRMQQGYNPPSLLPVADVYPLPASPDFLVTGNFGRSAEKGVLFAAKGGGLYLMPGDGSGRLGAPQRIALPGAVTALAAGEFRAADGFTDIAVTVAGPGGDLLLVFDDAANGFRNAVVQQPLAEPASAIEFGGLDDDPFMDIAVAAECEIVVVHGWGRHEPVAPASRVEHIPVAGPALRGLAVGEFAWDRQGRGEIAALSEDGTIHIVQHAQLDSRPFTQAELAQRTRGNVATRSVDIESVASWQPGRAAGWTESKTFATGNPVGPSSTSARPLVRTNITYRETQDLLVMGGRQPALAMVHPNGPGDRWAGEMSIASDWTSATLDVGSTPVAVLKLPKKLNGVTDLVMLSSTSLGPIVVPNAPNTTITVDRADDPAGAGLTAASACTAAANDCSLRGAFQFANNPLNNNTTINLPNPLTVASPAAAYVLSINGTNVDGCASGGVSSNANGDLGLNQTTTMTGAGAATTIIRQTGTGPANDGDRVMCFAETFPVGIDITFSGITISGGRDGADFDPTQPLPVPTTQVFGGGAIIGGELNNSLTLTNVTFVNNQATAAGLGGGAVQITGGDLTITNCTIGGSSGRAAYADRASTTAANYSKTSGAGISFTPSSPMHAGGTGILTVTGTTPLLFTTFSHNESRGSGGAGADVYTLAFASPGGIGTGSVEFNGNTLFTDNQALSTGSGAGLLNESIATTVKQTTFTNNFAENRAGAIYVAGASLLIDGTNPSVTMSGNTAGTPNTSSVSTASAVTVSGTNVIIGGDIEVSTGGSWTNNAGSSLAPTNVTILGGTFNGNNSTMNVGGNLKIQPAAIVGSTFNADTGTVNIAGNFTFIPGGSGPATSFNAGTGTFNFNGTGAQSISNGASITFNNLTDSNVTNPLTLNNSFAVNGPLTVNGANAVLSPAATAVISGTGTLTGTGTARASGADFLTQYTIANKTLGNLTIDYTGAGPQTVNNTPAYSNLTISASGTKTLQGNTTISRNLTINAGPTFASGNFNFSLGGNWTNGGTFAPGTGTVTFVAASGTQTLSGNTTFFNLTLNNAGATTNFGTTTTTVGNDLVATAGTMDGGTSTVIFTGVTDNAGAIGGANPKNFFNLQINNPAVISNTTGGNITIENNYANAGTFSQAAGLTTIFDIDNTSDGAHSLSGAGTTSFGNVTINASNTVDAGSHIFSVVGAAFTATGGFTGNTGTVNFNGVVPQSITGNGAKNFSGLLINNPSGVTLTNGAQAVDASVAGLLTLTTDFTIASGAILQQSGTSTGLADVLGTVRRTDLGAIERAFGSPNNTITINSGTPPTQMDVNLAKAPPAGFPAVVKVVPRDVTLSPTGGSGISATVKLRYTDTELAGPGITESRLILWKNISGAWTPQGGTVNAATNFVTLTGVNSFSEWAIAEGSDLTLSKANNVGGSAVTGQPWNWTLTATNAGAPATFTAGQTILIDNLPNGNLTYGAVTVQNVSNITGSGNISCAIASNDLTCTANGGSVTFDSNAGASHFDVVFSATPQAAATYQNPRGGGIAQIDPANVINESAEGNNSPTTNTVTVAKANTTTAITSDNPDPSVVGQPVTVQWSVTVNAPGAVGAALTGNVTVSDGTATCIAAVSAGQCNISFASAGAKSLTATYAGDSNYNGSASSPATAHTVNKADTTTTITSDSPDPSTPGQSVTVQWTVTANAPGAGTPTGNVTVTVSGGAETCSAAAGTGQCSLVLNATGIRTITASYAGDTNFNISSDTESHTVCFSSVVTANTDSGAGSLRQIIANACDAANITFDSAGVFATPQTITLTTGEILIDKNLTINAGSSQVAISGNNASRVFHVNSGKTLGVVGLTFTGGSSANGGALLNDGTLTIVNSTLSGNTSTADGGAVSSSATGALTLINTTLSGNTANGNGGGVIVLGGTMTSINSTITNNRADNDNDATGAGGGIAASGGTTILKNTIVAGNFNEDGASDAADDISGTVDAASSFNLIGTGGSGGLADGVNNNHVNVVNAGLGPLANNGGRTQTHALLSTSPAIEAGSNANLPADVFDLDADADVAEALPVDQRGTGFPRTGDSADADAIRTVDIGAFELYPAIEDIADKATLEDTPVSFAFNVGDGTIGFDSIIATSSDTTLVPNANLVITGSGSSRTLTITPSANLSGTATITVTATKTIGGTPLTATDTFVVTVVAVNDAPTIDAISNPGAINEDAGLQTVNLTGIGAGGGESQTLTVTAVSNNHALIPDPAVSYSSADPTGSISYTPVANASGTAIVTVTVQDDGGTLNGGVNTTVRTFTVTVNAVADTPSMTPASTTEDTQTTTGLVASRNAADGPEVTHVKITNVQNGTVYQNDGTTPIVAGAFITFAQASAGLKFTPAANFFGTASFDLQASTSAADAGLGGGVVTAQITVTPVADTPQVTGATTLAQVQTTSGLVITPNAVDGAEVTHFKITGISNGTLYQNDGTTAIAENEFITRAQGLAGLKFTPANGFGGAATFQVRAALDDTGTGLSAAATATITVNPYPTTTTLTSANPNPSDATQPVTVVYNVATAGGPVPTGNVTVSISGGSETCTGTAAAGQCTLIPTVPGLRDITATYAGDAATAGSASAPLAHTVNTCSISSIVTTTADSGPGSLRQVLLDACFGNTITFNIPGPGPHTIVIVGGNPFELAKNVQIVGPATGVTISGNPVSAIFNVDTGVTATLDGLTLVAGQSAIGGAVLNQGTLTIRNSTLSGNAASIAGGAIANNGALTLIGSTLSANTAGSDGGGIWSSGSAITGSLTIANSTISGNSSSGRGGGISNNTVPMTLTHVTVTANTAATAAGGVDHDGGTIANSIVAGNSAPSDPNLPSGVTLAGGNITSGDPMLGPLQNNGGKTFTHVPLSGSAALDAGDNALAAAAGLTTDQRGAGFARALDAGDANTTQTVDLGAVEADPIVEALTAKATSEDVPLVFTFNIGDASSAFDSMTAVSGNTTLLPNAPANIDVAGSGSTRTLTLTPAVDQAGTATVTVTATKTVGGVVQTSSSSFTLTVNAVNDAPTLDAIVTPAPILEDAALQTINLTGITAGGGESQTLTVTATSDNTALIPNPAVTYASPGATGSLAYTPVANMSGTATITVTVTDQLDATAVRTFVVTVTPVADTPSITNATTTVNVQTTSGLVVSRNAVDGAEATHVKVTGITGGTLFQADGVTPIANGSFITFAQGGAGLRFTPLTDSVATGHVTIQASTSAADGGLGGALVTADIVVNPLASTTTVMSSSNPSNPGQAVTFTATVTPSQAGASGTVQFTDGATPLGAPVALVAGTASFTTSTLTSGPHTIVAAYSGNSLATASTGTVTQVVRTAVTLSIGSSGNPTPLGQPVTITATPTHSGGGTAGGTMTFMEGAATLATTALSGGAASFTTSSLSLGVHHLTVQYSGDAAFAPASGVFDQTISCPVMTIDPATIPPAVLGVSYTVTFTQSGGVGAVAFAQTGSLPAGMAFDAATATLSGVPSAPGSYPITITATPANGCGAVSAAYTLEVRGGVTILTGADAGGGPHVRRFRALDGGVPATGALDSFFAFDSGFTGGVRVAEGDVNGDGRPDYIAGAGPGAAPEVRVFDGATGALLRSIVAFEPGFTGGVFVAAGDVNGDGLADVIVGSGTGRRGEIKVFSGPTGAVLRDVFVFSPAFTGGVRVASGDVNGDGFADLIAATGPGTAAAVTVLSGADLSGLRTFAPYPGFPGGVWVAVADVTGDGFADIVTGAGEGGGPHVRVFNGVTGAEAFGFFAFDPAFPGGVRVAAGDVTGDGRADIIVAQGPGGTPAVRVFDGATSALVSETLAYAAAWPAGVFVATNVPLNRMAVDVPVQGSTVHGAFALDGWAFEEGASDEGIDTIHVWALPLAGGAPQFLGVATVGLPRPDVAAYYGNPRVAHAGFHLDAPAVVPPGVYYVAIFAHSRTSGTFNFYRLMMLVVAP